MKEAKNYGYGSSATLPNAKASDGSGERSGTTRDGVAMGKMDNTGKDSKCSGGTTNKTVYVHQRKSYQ